MTDLEAEIRQFIMVYRASGNSYITTRRVADAIPASSKRVTPVMMGLVEEGLLVPWSTSKRTTYRIAIDRPELQSEPRTHRLNADWASLEMAAYRLRSTETLNNSLYAREVAP